MLGAFTTLGLLLAACTTPAPTLSEADPVVVCAASPDPIRLIGSGLSPTVTGGLGEEPQLHLPSVALSQGERTVAIDGSDDRLRWESDSELSVVLETGLAAGVWDATVYRADGASASLSPAFDALARPTLEGTSPVSLCHTRTDAPLHLEGTGLAMIGSAVPAVTIADQSASVTLGDCTPTDGAASVSLCSSAEVEIDATALPLGWVSLSLENPEPASCGAAEVTVEVRSPPTLSAVSPEVLCTAGGSLTITGTDLRDDTIVTVGGQEAALLTYTDATTLTVAFPDGLSSGTHDVTVTSPGGCSDTLVGAVEVVSTPLAYHTSPSSLPAGVWADVSVFVANVIEPVVDVWLEDGSGGISEIAWRWDAAEPGEVVLSVPDDLPVGSYSIGVQLEGSCGGTSSSVLEIIPEAGIALSAIEPAFAWTFDTTAVEVYAEDPVPAGMVDFAQTPTAVLISPSGSITALTGVRYRSASRLTATVPAELETGSHHLLVENPDGTLGLLKDAITVTTSAPPTISAVRPLSLSSSQDTTITLSGQDFREPSLSMTCRDEGTIAVEVLSWSYGEIVAEAASSQAGQTVCVLHVTNSDGTAAQYASLSITNPASNLFPWSAGPDLNIARRAPAAGAGRVDAVSRYLYALGGDSGDVTGALSSIEQAEVGVYGDLGEWTMLSAELPGPRTLAGLGVIGRYLYLVGGDSGTGALDEVWRAQILVPEDAPQLSPPSMFLGDEGLSAGTWQYAVSALYDAADPLNPGGESLASELLTLRLPELSGDLYQPLLSWSAVADAVGYRVYRSAAADEDALGWIADVEDPSLLDTGLVADSASAPLSVGELGEWVALDALTTPRSGACLTIAADPSPDPERLYLYAAGGLDDSGAVLDSIERLDVTVTSERSHTAGTWTLSDLTLSEARHSCGAYTVSADYHTVVEPGEDWVLFAGGADDSDRATGTVDAGLVTEDGELDAWQEVDGMSPGRAGFGLASASDTLYAFGGQQFRASSGGTSAEVEDPMPEIDNWNSLGTSLSEERLLPGSAQESSVIFVIGGETGSASATTSTDWTNY